MKSKTTVLQLLLAIVLVMALSPSVVFATVISTVDEAGVLTVTSDADDEVVITCGGGEVKINGADPDTGPATCAAITSIVVTGGPGANRINLGGVTEALFPNVIGVTVDGGAGADTIIASGFSDTLDGGPGDDALAGVESNDVVVAGPGRDLFVKVAEPIGPPLSVSVTSSGGIQDDGINPEPSDPLAPPLDISFAGPNYDTNGILTGFSFIPPDPIAAAGPNHAVSVVNVVMEWQTKAGVQQQSIALKDFFSPTLPISPTTWTFDPKIIYDQYEDRFVAVTLEQIDSGSNPNPGNNKSYIYLAVSDDSDPNGTWYYQVITATRTSGGFEYWFDYPGFAVDEDAVYITGNMFRFVANDNPAGISSLYIVDKGVGSGGLYDGGTSTTTLMDPAGAGYNVTYQPARVFGAGGVPGVGSIGTFLVGYGGLTTGGPGGLEAASIVRVDDPVGSPSLSASLVWVGDIEDVGGAFGWPALPDAPQFGSANLIEVNDRRTLHAVWRNNALWATTTISPNVGADINQTTAHWFEFDTSAVPAGAITLSDQGNIGGCNGWKCTAMSGLRGVHTRNRNH